MGIGLTSTPCSAATKSPSAVASSFQIHKGRDFEQVHICNSVSNKAKERADLRFARDSSYTRYSVIMCKTSCKLAHCLCILLEDMKKAVGTLVLNITTSL